MRRLAALLALTLLPAWAQAPEAPLPTVEALLEALESRQTASRALMERYSYTERTTLRTFDGKGRLEKAEEKEYEVTPLPGRAIRRLVKVDGKALSEKEAAKEDARVLKEAQKAAEEEGQGGKQVGLRSLLKVWEVTAMRRAERNGAPVLVVDFRPKAKPETKGKAEEMAAKLEGSLVLDEAAMEPLHLDARLVKPVRFMGFLASVAEGGTLSQDFQRINGEITMPSRLEAKFQARVLFSHDRVELESRWSDFKKFGMEAGTTKDTELLPKAR